MAAAIRAGWAWIPPPPAEDLKYLAWLCSEEAWKSLVNIAPMAVDLSAPGFLSCDPLFDLPPAASAAYLGSYLLALLEGMAFQQDIGMFSDIVTRAHVLHCLSDADFWQNVIRPHLPPECQEVLEAFALYLARHRELLALSAEQSQRIVALSSMR